MAATPSSTRELGSPLPEFRLPDTVSGQVVSSRDFAGRPLVVSFICNHCPFVRHILEAYSRFGEVCAREGVAHVAISSNDVATYPQDGPERMRELAQSQGFVFPYLFDESQQVARAFGAQCTPEFFVFDGSGCLAYRGQFDASRPSNDVPPTGGDLLAAVRAVASGQPPAAEQRPSIGCNIKWRVA